MAFDVTVGGRVYAVAECVRCFVLLSRLKCLWQTGETNQLLVVLTSDPSLPDPDFSFLGAEAVAVIRVNVITNNT